MEIHLHPMEEPHTRAGEANVQDNVTLLMKKKEELENKKLSVDKIMDGTIINR